MAVALGFLSGLGVGGGSLLILYLTVVLQMDPSSARTLNLLFFLPTAASALVCHWKNGYLHRPTLRSAAWPAVLLAILGAWISTSMDVEILRKPFGVYLLLSGVMLLLPQKKKEDRSE